MIVVFLKFWDNVPWSKYSNGIKGKDFTSECGGLISSIGVWTAKFIILFKTELTHSIIPPLVKKLLFCVWIMIPNYYI